LSTFVNAISGRLASHQPGILRRLQFLTRISGLFPALSPGKLSLAHHFYPIDDLCDISDSNVPKYFNDWICRGIRQRSLLHLHEDYVPWRRPERALGGTWFVWAVIIAKGLLPRTPSNLLAPPVLR